MRVVFPFHSLLLIAWVSVSLLLSGAQAFTLDSAVQEAGGKPRRLALCIGINGYSGSWRALDFAVADAVLMADTLGEYGYEVTLLVDDQADPDSATFDPNRVPTLDNIRRAIYDVSSRSQTTGDTVIIYFAGHGYLNDVGESSLVMADQDEDHDLLPLSELFAAMDSSRCRARKRLFIFDSCQSGSTETMTGSSAGFLEALKASKNLAVMSACDAKQSSYEHPDQGHGRFTWALAKSLRGEGEAGRNRRGFLYVTDILRDIGAIFQAQGWDRKQNPQLWGKFDADGFDIAHRPAPEQTRDLATLNSKDAEIYQHAMQQAIATAGTGNFAGAADYCSAALWHAPGDADGYAYRAWCHYSVANYEQARRDAERALAALPEQGLALYVHGVASLALRAQPDHGQLFADAQSRLQLALAQMDTPVANPLDSPRGHADVGGPPPRVAGLPGYLAAAIRPDAWNAAAYIRAADPQADTQALIAAFSRVIESPHAASGTVATAMFNRGVLHLRARDRAAAEADFRRCAALPGAPVDLVAKCRINLAGGHRARQEFADAIRLYTTCIETPGVAVELVADALTSRADLYRQSGEASLAMADWTRCSEWQSAPDDSRATALISRAQAQLASGNREAAILDFVRCTELRHIQPPTLAMVEQRLAELQAAD